jgi:DNA-binding beta-propeller fold protein YncE
MNKMHFPACIALLCIGLALSAQTGTSGYKVSSNIHLPGTGGWDYLTTDDPAGRLYVSHGTLVQVVDTKTGQLAGVIENTPGVHGIAIAADLNKGFISCGRSDSVLVFDLKTLKVTAGIAVTGKNPDAILYDKFSGKVFVHNGRTANSTVIDARTHSVLGTIALDGKPEYSVSDGNGKIFLNIEDKSLIVQINAKTLEVEQKWSISPGEEPTGLALDNETHRLFSVCGNKMMVIVNARDGKIITTLPIGEGCDGVMFDPSSKRAYSSNGEGTVTVVQEGMDDHFTVLETIKTQPGARTLTIDKAQRKLYLPTAEYEQAPAATADNPRPRRTVKPGSFVVLEVSLSPFAGK